MRGRRVRLVVADDEDLARTSLINVLCTSRSLEVVGEARNGREAIEQCRSLKPDLVLVDLRMPEMDGLVATRTIKQESPATVVMVVTAEWNPIRIVEALRLGANGYVLKGTARYELLSAIRAALRGSVRLQRDMATWLVAAIESDGDSTDGRMTDVERNVLQLYAEGRTEAEIARNLAISTSGVGRTVKQVLDKLSLPSVFQFESAGC